MAKKVAIVEVKKELPMDGYYVLKSFKDNKKYGNNTYAIGDEVSHLSNERLSLAIELGVVEFRENDITEESLVETKTEE